jgi:four helix bundle protein
VADFKKLKVWQKSHALSLSVDRVCKQIRSVHYASLRSQMFRAAMSIPANIAEGRRQTSDKQFARFLGYSLNSASELEHHLIVARDTQNIPESDFVPLISQTITVRKCSTACCVASQSRSQIRPRRKPHQKTRRNQVPRKNPLARSQ